MKTLKSYIGGRWREAAAGFTPLVDPSTEDEIARVSTEGLDFREAIEWARDQGGPALRAMTFAQRGALLKAMSKALREHRDELLELSRRNNGTLHADGAFDIDGASGTLAYYAGLAKGLGERQVLVEGDEMPLSREGTFWGRHLWVPRQGVAVHINAFNFPAWGFAEKAACALLAGMPVISKPASSTAWVAQRCVEIVIAAAILPPGALQVVCGSAGNLLDLVEPQDVLAFTGSADTSQILRQRTRVQAVNSRFNVEADSLNAAVLGPDVEPGSATMSLFLRDVVREMTQKAGQKCTAVRRILLPEASRSVARDALIARLETVVTGNPADDSVSMGPLATSAQLASAVEGIAALAGQARLLHGAGERIDGVGSPAGKGFFLAPTAMSVDDAFAADLVHQREVFAPVATLMPYDGTARQAAEVVALAGGTLVTSLYSDDREWVNEFLTHGGSATGRLYVGSEESSSEAPGSGVALPQALHGGPGRAGGGEELGGLIGVQLYLQRLAIQGGPGLVRSFA